MPYMHLDLPRNCSTAVKRISQPAFASSTLMSCKLSRGGQTSVSLN